MALIKILLLCILLLINKFCFALEQLSFCHGLQSGQPYIYPDKSKPESLTGILVDLIKATSVEAGIDIKLYKKPWKRCIFDVKHGYADGALAAIWQPEREQWGAFPKTSAGVVAKSHRLWTANYTVFTNKSNSIQWDGRNFNGITTGIAAPLGYVVFKQLKQKKLLAPNVYSAHKGFQLVAKNRLDGYIIEDYIGRSIIKNLKLSKHVIPIATPYMQTDLYLVLSKKSANITNENALLIWQSLAKVRERDAAMLLQKYAAHVPLNN